MSADKYPSIFSRQMEAIVYLSVVHTSDITTKHDGLRRTLCLQCGHSDKMS